MGEAVVRRKEVLAIPDPVPASGQGGQAGDEADGHAGIGFSIFGVVEVRIDHAEHRDGSLEHIHGVGVSGKLCEALENEIGNPPGCNELVIEPAKLVFARQRTTQEQVGDFGERRPFGQFLDAVAPVDENPFLAVDVADLGVRNRYTSQAGILHPNILVHFTLPNGKITGWNSSRNSTRHPPPGASVAGRKHRGA